MIHSEQMQLGSKSISLKYWLTNHATAKKVQVGNDQENQKKNPTPKTEVGITKLTIRYLYLENIS